MASEGPEDWTELKAFLADALNRDDLTTQIPQFIAFGEDHLNQVLFTPDREITADLSTTAEEITLPTDLWQIKSAYLTTDPKTFLEQMTLGELRNTYSAAATGRPQNYALRGAKLILGPAPDSTYTLKLAYVQTIPALNAGALTNWLLTRHPTVYIQAALFEAHQFLRDVDAMAVAKIRRDEIVDLINATGVRRSHGQAPRRIRSPVIV